MVELKKTNTFSKRKADDIYKGVNTRKKYKKKLNEETLKQLENDIKEFRESKVCIKTPEPKKMPKRLQRLINDLFQ